jgi:polyisoprenoid-binding protein YceI
MAIRTVGFALALVLAVSTLALASDVYQIDPQHTDVGFSIRHMVINNVKGSFKDFAGTIEYDGKDVLGLKADGTIQVKSVDTGIAKRDDHLRSPDFFDVEKYPDIKFQGERVEKHGESYAMIGKFTMHGVTKDIEIPFSVTGPVKDPWGQMRIGMEGHLTLNRQDYGVNWNKTLDNGGVLVGDEVKIEINAEAVMQEPAKK